MTDRDYQRYPRLGCQKCGKERNPRKRQNGVMESPNEFRARKFCGACYGLGHRGWSRKHTSQIANDNAMHNQLLAAWK